MNKIKLNSKIKCIIIIYTIGVIASIINCVLTREIYWLTITVLLIGITLSEYANYIELERKNIMIREYQKFITSKEGKYDNSKSR